MSKVGKRQRELFAKLDAIYASLPTIACQGKCGIACGPIVLTDAEARRLQLATHVPPKTRPDRHCIYLTARGRCAAYAVRPLICRVYGLIRMLSCPFGCAPDRWLTNEEFFELALALERVGGGRQLRTTPDGLAHVEGESFVRVATKLALSPTGHRSAAAQEANEKTTQALRALHGGRIVVAIDETVP